MTTFWKLFWIAVSLAKHYVAVGSSGNDERVRVPVIDIAPWFEVPVRVDTNHTSLTKDQQTIVNHIRKACREVGFFQIVGGFDFSSSSGEDSKILQHAWKASRDFFELSSDEKLQHRTTDTQKYPYGYERSEKLVRGKLLDGKEFSDYDNETVSGGGADLKETFALGPPTDNGSGMPPRQWIHSPNVPVGFRSSLEAYYQKMEDLSLVLLQIFAVALNEPSDFFRDKMDHHMSALRLVHYYPLEKGSTSDTTRLVRAGAHTDYGALTILAAEDEGLEVLLREDPERSTRRWYPVPVVPGAFVVNLGDLMQRWTNNEWISTMHRVVMPSTQAMERRYSMAYFVNINGDTPIEPLECCKNHDDYDNRGPVITAGEHLMAKHLASMGIDIEENTNQPEDISVNEEL